MRGGESASAGGPGVVAAGCRDGPGKEWRCPGGGGPGGGGPFGGSLVESGWVWWRRSQKKWSGRGEGGMGWEWSCPSGGGREGSGVGAVRVGCGLAEAVRVGQGWDGPGGAV